MDPNSASQLDASGNETVDASSLHRNPSDHILNVLLSDSFQEQFNRRMDELPRRDDTRAEAHFSLGGQFNLHYRRTGSLALLEHAIRHTEQALEELPKPHEKLKSYVAVYSHLLEQKAVETKTIEDADCYISGKGLSISFLDECNFKEEKKKRELGCAYLSNYSQTRDIENLKLAINTLEQCFDTTGKRYPQATVYLGAALT